MPGPDRSVGPGRADTSAAVVLSGGASRRFGRDKSGATVDGTPMLERVVDAVRPLVDEVVVVGPWAPVGVDHVLEADRYRGPLAGLAFGLGHVSAAHALVLAGDHPLIRPEVLHLLLDRRHLGDAVVPTGRSGPQPLVALYGRQVLGAAQRLLDAGERRLLSLLGHVDTAWLGEGVWRAVDPDGASFLDVDTPADLAALERRMQSPTVAPPRDGRRPCR